MHKALSSTLLAILGAVVVVPAQAAQLSDAARWQALARADLDAVHARIVEAHPGVIDEENVGFRAWVEQGYEQAKDHLPHVMSYDTAMAAVRFYTSGFEDGHLMYSDDVRTDYPIWVTGWSVVLEGGQHVVARSLPDWSVPLPPVGAIWIGCDGLSAQQVLETRVGPFSDRRAGELGDRIRTAQLWMRRPVADNLRECEFRTAAGEHRKLPVAYQPISTGQYFEAASAVRVNRGATPSNAFGMENGVLWVRAGNFQLREGSGDREQLEAMLSGLAATRGAHAIVFDVRGNRGGDSSIGDRIFEAATGGLEVDTAGMDSLPRYYAQWRVSDFLVEYIDATTDELKALYGEGSPRVAEHEAFREQVVEARAAGQPWVEQDAGRTMTQEDVAARNGRLRRFDGKIVLLTDSGCVSACLDFADIVLQVPGVIHAGQRTGADSVYMVGSRSRMPSGNRLVMPVKVWRNRARANNQALVPDVPVNLDHDDRMIREDVLGILGTR